MTDPRDWLDELWHRVYIEEVARRDAGIGHAMRARDDMRNFRDGDGDIHRKLAQESRRYVREYRDKIDASARILADESVRAYLEYKK